MIGRTLGDYRILEEIGGGGMGVVYKALDTRHRRYVALKVLAPQYAHDRSLWKRFQIDGKVAEKLRHPHIIAVYVIDQATGVSYIAMEYADGGSLENRLRSAQPLDLTTAARVAIQVASALDFAHSRGVVHRDIKPSNILLRRGGQAVLSDFGLAKAEDMSRITDPGSIMGTLEYMSPEQCKGLDVDHRSDIYSLGVLCYQMLTGRLPFRKSTRVALLHAHIYELPPPARRFNASLPPQVEQVLSKALSKARGARYASAGEFASALVAALGQKVVTPVPPTVTTLLPMPLIITASVAVLALALLLLVGSGSGSDEEIPAPPPPSPINRVAFESQRHGESEIYVMDANGTGQSRLTNNYVKDWAPAWSPDGQRIAFVSDRDGNMEIYVMNADGSDVTRLTYDAGFDSRPCWSPDQSRIAFDSDRDGDGEIYVMDTKGRNLLQLTHNSVADGDPDWSPDGSYIVFNTQRDGNLEVYVMSVNGTGQVNLTNHLARDSLPVWSPDGTQIAFESDRTGNLDIYVMDSEGTNPTRLTGYSGEDQQPSWSPDGRKIIFSRHDGPGDVWNIHTVTVEGLIERRITSSSSVETGPDW